MFVTDFAEPHLVVFGRVGRSERAPAAGMVGGDGLTSGRKGGCGCGGGG